MKTKKVHMDGTQTSGPLHRSLCGYFGVPTTHDATKASCKVCLALLRRGSRARDHFTPVHPSDDVAHQLHLALAAELPKLAPTAGSPPRITAPLWDASCRGAEHRRCGSCELCAWEREAEMFSFASPWAKGHQLARPEGAPRWGSLSAALVALLEHQQGGRARGSALGAMLDRLKRGEAGGDRDPRRMVGREFAVAADVVHVEVALARAYAGGWGALSAEECMRVLLERLHGVLAEVTPYDVLAERYGVGAGTLRAVVKHGRAVMTEDLVARGLIPTRSMRGPRVAEASTWQAAEVNS